MWTSGGAILRDLSRAQGAGGRGGHSELRALHSELRALRPRDRPPPPPSASRSISEETEEYVRALVPADDDGGAGACEGAPDLRHIQQMLDMMRKLNIVDANDEALISELDSYAIERPRTSDLCRAELGRPTRTPSAAAPAPGAEYLPPAPAPAPGTEYLPPRPNKHKKRRRNIALESIIEALNSTSEQLTLLKPEDLITKFQENINQSSCGTDHKHDEGTASYITPHIDKIDSNDYVSHWMKQMMNPIQTNSQSKQVVGVAMKLDPATMFKKKVKGEDAKPCTKLSCETAFKNAKCLGNGSASYVPSGDASRCYQRYLENNKQIQIRREEATQLATLITEALERAAQAEATELAIQSVTTELAIQVDATELVMQGEGTELAIQAEGTELAIQGEGMELAIQAEGTEFAIQAEGTELAIQAEATELAIQAEGRQVAAVEPAVECGVVGEAVAAAPSGARLAAPRRCLPRERCLVCARVTRRLREGDAARQGFLGSSLSDTDSR